MARKPKIERFNQRVLSKYQIYNNLFLTLPFSSLKKTSILLPLFTDFCKSQYKNNNDPKSIIDSFFSNYLPKINSCEKNDILFNFIKYVLCLSTINIMWKINITIYCIHIVLCF